MPWATQRSMLHELLRHRMHRNHPPAHLAVEFPVMVGLDGIDRSTQEAPQTLFHLA